MIRRFLLDTAEIVLCLYGLFKHLITRIAYIKQIKQIIFFNLIIGLLALCLAVLSLVVLVVILLPLAGYKKVIDIYLKLKHKENYGGLLEGIDTMFALETENSRHIINCLLLLEYDGPDNQIMAITRKIFNDHALYQFTSLRQRVMGYFYRLQNQVAVHDLIKEWELSDEARSDKQIFDFDLTKISNTPMPMNDTACFELLASTKPIKFSTNNNNAHRKQIYPLLIRIHHSVGDGIALLSFLLKNVADEQISVEEEIAKKFEAIRAEEKCRKPKNLDHFIKSAVNMMKNIAGANIYSFPPTSEADNNSLHGPPLSGNQILTSYLEETPGYITKIKSIKKRIPGSTFTDVILTAVSAGFYRHFKDNADEIPNSISLSCVMKPIEKNLEYTVTQTGKKEYNLGNNFSIAMLRLPINIEANNPATALRERMLRIKDETEKLKNSIDVLVYYWQLIFFTNLLPAPILNILIKQYQTGTVSFSNLPGIQAVHIRGFKVHDIVFWVPAVGNLGVGLSILTYDNRFQMGLLVDKVLMQNHSEAHTILDNIIGHIDKIDEELNSHPMHVQ